MAEMRTLENSRILSLPASGYYVPDFISPDLEASILDEIAKFPENRWTVLSRRRLLSLPSQLTGTARDTLIAGPMPTFLTKVIFDKFADLQIFKDSDHGAPNHCLINEYHASQGIFPHEDGAAYFPITATVSLASHTVLNIYEKNESGERKENPRWRILQEPRSLLVTTGNMYRDTLHGIDEIETDDDLGPETIANWTLLGDQSQFEGGSKQRETRVSLTYRDVIKVTKIGNVFKFMNNK